MSSSALAVTAQLVLLAWFVLFLLAAAMPLGLVAAVGVDLALTGRYLVPGTTVSVPPIALLALLLCFLGVPQQQHRPQEGS